jgi:hypothetical protein
VKIFGKRVSAPVCAVQRTDRGYAYQVDAERTLEVCVHRATTKSLVPASTSTRYVHRIKGVGKGMIKRKVTSMPAYWRLMCHHCPTVAYHPATVPGAVPLMVLEAFSEMVTTGGSPSVRTWTGLDRSSP